jgi:hypothetical protein
MQISITNNAGNDTLASGFQVGLQHDLDLAPCTSNRDDIRIVYQMTEIPRVIDEVGTDEWTWFRTQAAIQAGDNSNDYWLYCGNPSPPPAPADPTVVFDFYDGFGGPSIDTSVWTTHNGVTITNGQLVCGSSGPGGMADNGVVTKTLTFGANHAVDFIATAASATSSNFWAGFQNGTMDVVPWLQWYTNQPSIIAPDYYVTGDSAPWYGTSYPLDTAPHFYGVENYGSSSMYRREDVVYESHTYTHAPPALLSVRLWNGSATPTVSYDMVRIRQAIDPPPVVGAGTPMTY